MTIVNYEIIKHLTKKNNEEKLKVAIEKIESNAKVLLKDRSPVIKVFGENILEILEVIVDPVQQLLAINKEVSSKLAINKEVSSKYGSYGFDFIYILFDGFIEATRICYCGYCFKLIARENKNVTVITGIRYHDECLKISHNEYQDFLSFKEKNSEGIKE